MDGWQRAGDGCTCLVNPHPFTHYGIAEPGDSLEPDPRCKKHFARWTVACINWGLPNYWPHAMTYVLVDGSSYMIRYHATWGDAIRWLDEHGGLLAGWADTITAYARGVAR